MSDLPPRQGPLRNVKILDLGVLIAGPLVSCMMGDLGADVVKVERPTGDPCRLNGRHLGDVSLTWKVFGRNKRTIAIDFTTESGRTEVLELIAAADIVVENFRPGTLERAGLGYEEMRKVNPDVILVRVSGYGQTGPYRDRPGFGTIAESIAGFTALNGWPDGPPTLPPIPLADSTAALAATVAALAALNNRHATGEGELIDVNLIEPLLSMLACQMVDFSLLGIEPKRLGNRLDFAAPRGAYLTKDDKWFAISGATPTTAKRIFEAVGKADFEADPRLATNAARSKNVELVDQIIQDWAKTVTRDEALAILADTGAPVGPVYAMSDIVVDEHLRSRPSFVDVADPELESVRMPNVFAKLSNNPGKIRFAGRPIDADRDSIRADWHSGASVAAAG